MANELIAVEGIEEVQISTDDADETVDPARYSITGYGADFDVEGLVRRLNRGDIEIPEFQRVFVWNQKRASRFIESLLLGLPVPGIFLYRDKGSRILRVIDGQQRLETLRYFFCGIFGESGAAFKLTGVQERFAGLTYESLPAEDRRRLNDSIIHASVIQQEAPDDDGSSQFAIFERLNTTSTPLSPQEIRAAIYRGDLNDLLSELNKCVDWRMLIGKPNRRKRDQELILRFLALYFDANDYRPTMKGFLNKHMKSNQNLEKHSAQTIRDLFHSTIGTIIEKLDRNAFRPERAVNAALLDALMVGIARRLSRGPH